MHFVGVHVVFFSLRSKVIKGVKRSIINLKKFFFFFLHSRHRRCAFFLPRSSSESSVNIMISHRSHMLSGMLTILGQYNRLVVPQMSHDQLPVKCHSLPVNGQNLDFHSKCYSSHILHSTVTSLTHMHHL